MTKLEQITVAAIVRAAGRGLLTAVEARLLIDRIEAHTTTPQSSIQDSQQTGVGEQILVKDHAIVVIDDEARRPSAG